MNKEEMIERLKILTHPWKYFYEINTEEQLVMWYDELLQYIDLMENPSPPGATITPNMAWMQRLDIYNFQLMKPRLVEKYTALNVYKDYGPILQRVLSPITLSDVRTTEGISVFGDGRRKEGITAKPNTIDQNVLRQFMNDSYDKSIQVFVKDSKPILIETIGNPDDIIVACKLHITDTSLTYTRHPIDYKEVMLKHIDHTIGRPPKYHE